MTLATAADKQSPGLHGISRVDAVEKLRSYLHRPDRRTDAQWIAALSPRKLAEIEFHDNDRDPNVQRKSETDSFARDTGNRKYYATVDASRTYMREWIARNSAGKVVLDYACGNGAHAMLAAEAGAGLAVGLDISSVSVGNCKTIADQKGLTNTVFVQGDCEATDLPDASVDTVVCCGMLHHLDLSFALPELRRIMKPGARLLAMEALDYNPAIKLYRRLTPQFRTDFETDHILDLKDIEFASRFFDVGEMRFWHLCSIPTAFLRGTQFFRPALAVANAIDDVVLRIPGLRRMAWMFTFELVRKSDD